MRGRRHHAALALPVLLCFGTSRAAFNASRLEFVATQRTWQAAQLDCQSRGANLVQIANDQENAAVLALLQAHKNEFPSSNGYGGAWIGATDAAQEGKWGTYTKWNNGEPNNSGDEDCAAMWVIQGGKCYTAAMTFIVTSSWHSQGKYLAIGMTTIAHKRTHTCVTRRR